MKFGLFYEHQLPRPWNEDSEYTLLQGEEIGRPSRIDLRIDRDGDRITEVWVGGASVMVSQGILLV